MDRMSEICADEKIEILDEICAMCLSPDHDVNTIHHWCQEKKNRSN